MKAAKIFLAEDDDDMMDLERRIITRGGHAVEVEATSLKEALAKIPAAKEKGVNVAVLDGCLSKGFWQADGEIIAEALRKEIPGIKIISCSGMPGQKWGDVNLEKMGIAKIGKIISEL